MSKYKASDLIDSITTTLLIECSKCGGSQEDHNTDEEYFSEDRFDEGWRATPTHTYCPSCAAIYLNKKK